MRTVRPERAVGRKFRDFHEFAGMAAFALRPFQIGTTPAGPRREARPAASAVLRRFASGNRHIFGAFRSVLWHINVAIR